MRERDCRFPHRVVFVLSSLIILASLPSFSTSGRRITSILTEESPKEHDAGTTTDCGCPSTCDDLALSQRMNGLPFTCGERIQYLMTTYGDSHYKACSAAVQGKACGLECDPDRCITSSPAETTHVEDYISSSSNKLAILHVGPHKTGTTTLQRLMDTTLWSSLEEDGYLVPQNIPGQHEQHKSMANIAFSLQTNQPSNENTWNAFKHFLSQNKTKSVLISSEEFDRGSVDIEKLKMALEPKYNVRVLVVYRRYFEWIYSLYGQIHRMKAMTYSGGVDEFPSFVEWLKKNDSDLTAPARHLQPSFVRDRYRAYFDDVEVLNFHAAESLEATFFCKALNNEHGQACQRVLNMKSTPQNPRSQTLEYERLLFVAVKHGLIPNKHNLPNSIQKVKQFVDGMDEVPMDCLEDSFVDSLWKISLDQEVEMVPEWFQEQGGEEGLRSAFEKFRGSGALCSLNVTDILMRDDFQQFLSLEVQ